MNPFIPVPVDLQLSVIAAALGGFLLGWNLCAWWPEKRKSGAR